MSHWNLSDHSIAFARWRHIPSLLAQSLPTAVTRCYVWLAATALGKSAQAVEFKQQFKTYPLNDTIAKVLMILVLSVGIAHSCLSIT